MTRPYAVLVHRVRHLRALWDGNDKSAVGNLIKRDIYIDTYAMNIKHSPRHTTSWRGDQLSNVVSRACAQRCSSDVHEIQRLFVKHTSLNRDANKKRGCLCDICIACDISQACEVEIKLMGQIGSWVMT